MVVGTGLQTEPSCLPHAEEGPQHMMATTRPGGVCVVSYQHGNPFLRSSARGKACCKQPALQLRLQGLHGSAEAAAQLIPVLRSETQAASAMGEARQLSQASLKHASSDSFTFFVILLLCSVFSPFPPLLGQIPS